MSSLASSLEHDFRRFGKDIETDPLAVLLARWRRDIITSALMTCPDVAEVIPSGSLARGTHVGPIHDLDLIVVFRASQHPDWGGSGASAQAALEHLQTEIGETLQAGQGRPLGLVQRTELRNHVVKCALDPSLGPLDAVIPSAPPVDIMPAIRVGSHLRVPERRSHRWVEVDPERLIKMVAAREREWANFDEVVRMIKVWAEHQGIEMKSLAVEVLVLKYCPRPRFFESLSCSDAVARFFEAASRAHITSLVDPTGRCGKIDPHMNYEALREALEESAGLARRAVEAEQAWQDPYRAQERHTHPEILWREIFGNEFARPSIWSWLVGRRASRYPAEARSWFDEMAQPPPVPAWEDRAYERSWDHQSEASRPHRAEEPREPEGASTRAGRWAAYEQPPRPTTQSAQKTDYSEPTPERRGPAPVDGQATGAEHPGGPPGLSATPAPAVSAREQPRPPAESLADTLRPDPVAVPVTPVIFG
jgi:hypothetical protein